MAATADQIAQLRRMCALSRTDTTYSSAVLAGYIERYPLTDKRGEEPFTWDTSTTPPHQDANITWIASYDLNAAAADVWDEIASAAAANFDFATDGQSFNRSQAYQQATNRARHYRARRQVTSITLVPAPHAPQYDPTVGNLPEPADM